MRKIIIVEDDYVIREELETLLKKYGYDVAAPSNFHDVVAYVEKEKGDLILLDINLPVFDGYYICREIRKVSEIPIIIVTSRDNKVDELMSMNLGADDFVTKPYDTEILLARISSVLKRTYGNAQAQEMMVYNNLRLNLSNATVTVGETSLELSKNEMKILAYLIKNKGHIISRDSLMDYLWQSDFFVDYNTLSVNIARLRRKLEEIGMENAIETKRGLGYMMP